MNCLQSGRLQITRHRDQLCQLSEVLGGGCKVEFVAHTAWTSQSQPAEPENALEMGEQHLDLLSKLA